MRAFCSLAEPARSAAPAGVSPGGFLVNSMVLSASSSSPVRNRSSGHFATSRGEIQVKLLMSSGPNSTALAMHSSALS